jgi:DNA repair exonuclease SbcCD ATPase subunit
VARGDGTTDQRELGGDVRADVVMHGLRQDIARSKERRRALEQRGAAHDAASQQALQRLAALQATMRDGTKALQLRQAESDASASQLAAAEQANASAAAALQSRRDARAALASKPFPQVCEQAAADVEQALALARASGPKANEVEAATNLVARLKAPDPVPLEWPQEAQAEDARFKESACVSLAALELDVAQARTRVEDLQRQLASLESGTPPASSWSSSGTSEGVAAVDAPLAAQKQAATAAAPGLKGRKSSILRDIYSADDGLDD